MATSPETRSQNSDQFLWRFANCEFDDLRYELRVAGQAVEMERKPLDLLRYLLSKSGEIVKKEELLEAVWPGVLVVDASLATAVSKLRKVLGHSDCAPHRLSDSRACNPSFPSGLGPANQ